MKATTLLPYQETAMDFLSQFPKSAGYLEMGLGKTFIGSETIKKWWDSGIRHIVVLCQLSKVGEADVPDTWMHHLATYTDIPVYNGRKDLNFEKEGIFVLNYDMAIRRKELSAIPQPYGIICDESSILQNRRTKRSLMMLGKDRAMKSGIGSKAQCIQLLSGTPCNGKYENLWVQARLLGYKGSYNKWLSDYCEYTIDPDKYYYIITGYKNVDALIKEMHKLGCYFLKVEEAIDLPEHVNITHISDPPKEYKKLCRTGTYVNAKGEEIIADTTLKQYLEERKLCAMNPNKYALIQDIIESTEKRVVVLCNFVEEYTEVKRIALELGRPVSEINGSVKDRTAFDKFDNAVLIIQYQAGSKGGNFQLASHMILASPPVSSENYMQAKARIKRVGQKDHCFYYELVGGKIEESIYESVRAGRDYTLALYEKELDENGNT